MSKFKKIEVDSVVNISKADWHNLKLKHEKTIETIDTIFKNSLGQKQVKIEVRYRMYANQYFSISGNHDRFIASTYNDKAAEKDEYGLGYKIAYSYSTNKTFSTWEYYKPYNMYLDSILNNSNKSITVKRLKTSDLVALVYIIRDLNNDEIFNDKYGFQALEELSETKIIELGKKSGILNQNFSLWYNNWYAKLILVIQLIIYLIIGITLFDRKSK